VAFKETTNERIFLMKDLAAVEEAVGLAISYIYKDICLIGFGLGHEHVIRSRKVSEQDKKYQHEKDKAKLVLSIHGSSLLRSSLFKLLVKTDGGRPMPLVILR
jgi:hypothetical protein